FAAGIITGRELAAVEDQAITDAVRLQEEVGLQSATDGEFRREQWHSDFIYSIPGVEKGALVPAIHAYREGGEVLSWQPNTTDITAKLKLSETIFGDPFPFLRDTVTAATPKITVPSPSMVHFRVDLSGSPYDDYAEFRSDVAAVYAAEVAGLYQLGC